MKLTEFRKLIKEEIRKVLKEGDDDPKTFTDLVGDLNVDNQRAFLRVIPQMLNTPAENIIVIPKYKGGASGKWKGDETEKGKILYDFYEQPEYRKTFDGGLGWQYQSDQLTVGGMYWSKKGKAFYWDSPSQDYYILSKSTLDKIEGGQKRV